MGRSGVILSLVPFLNVRCFLYWLVMNHQLMFYLNISKQGDKKLDAPSYWIVEGED